MQYRDLVQGRSKASGSKHKAQNAVEQQKARDKEVKAALKQQKADSVAKKHDEDEARKRTIKEERYVCHSLCCPACLRCVGAHKAGAMRMARRAANARRLFAEKTGRRARDEARKEAQRGDKGVGGVCEHGIHKCRICHPVHGKVDHRAVAAAVRGSLDDSEDL